MIRYTTDSDWILIPQNAHAESCGVMAEHLNSDVVGIPSRRGTLGITLHDCGWPLHDNQPTLNPTGDPTHVFQTPVAVTTRLWTESASRAAQRDSYAGLLASVHGLHLAAFAVQAPRDRQALFELNKFQHAQVEFQEAIRKQIGMRIDQPMHHGLAQPGADPVEDELIRDYRALRALDQISLAALCSETLFDDVMFASPEAVPASTRIEIHRAGDFSLSLSPWPFNLKRVDISVPAKRILRQWLPDSASLQELYAATPTERIEFHLSPA